MKKICVLIVALCALVCQLSAETTKENCPKETINGKVYYRYQVEKSIGLYRISVNFGVSQAEIIEANPELKERGLQLDEVIYIPCLECTAELEEAKKAEEAERKAEKREREKAEKAEKKSKTRTEIPVPVEAPITTQVVSEPIAKELPKPAALVENKKPNVALLLPLQATNEKRDQTMNRFFDFYAGALIATYDIQENGTSIDLHVFDIEKNDLVLDELIRSGQLDDMDAILGPAYALQVMQVAEFCKTKQIPTLLPFADNVAGLENNPYLMQFNATEEQKAQTVVDYLHAHIDNTHIILVEANEADIPSSIRKIRHEIMERELPYTMTTISTILSDTLGNIMSMDKENILILNTDKFSNVQVLLPRLITASQSRSLTLYSQFAWPREKISLPQIYTSVFSTEIEPNMTHYDLIYDTYFGHTLSGNNPRYDLLGYDLMRELVAHLLGKEYYGLQSDIQFVQIQADGGYQNANIQIKRQ